MAKYVTFADYLKAEYKGPYMATDIVIRYDSTISVPHSNISVPWSSPIVLIERKNPPYGIATPGGMAERMRFDLNAVKEAREETGLQVIIDDIERPLCVLSRVDQDPRAFIASVAYTAAGYGVVSPDPKEDAKCALIVSLNEAQQLVNDEKIWAAPHHRRIIELYLKEAEQMVRIEEVRQRG